MDLDEPSKSSMFIALMDMAAPSKASLPLTLVDKRDAVTPALPCEVSPKLMGKDINGLACCSRGLPIRDTLKNRTSCAQACVFGRRCVVLLDAVQDASRPARRWFWTRAPSLCPILPELARAMPLCHAVFRSEVSQFPQQALTTFWQPLLLLALEHQNQSKFPVTFLPLNPYRIVHSFLNNPELKHLHYQRLMTCAQSSNPHPVKQPFIRRAPHDSAEFSVPSGLAYRRADPSMSLAPQFAPD